MQNIENIDKLLEGIAKPETQSGMAGLTDMLSEADTVMRQFETIVSRLDSMGLKPLIVRALGVKMGVDPETPLSSDSTNAIIPSSPDHQGVMEAINRMTPDQLREYVNHVNTTGPEPEQTTQTTTE